MIEAAGQNDSKRFWSFFKNTKYISNNVADYEWSMYDYFKSIFDVSTDEIILEIDFNHFIVRIMCITYSLSIYVCLIFI